MAPKDTYSLKLADRAQLDRAKADLAGAQARVAEAKAELADLEALSSIESPVSGRVVSLSAASGDRVARDSPVLIIQPDHNLWLRAIFYDMPTALLTPGRAARFLPANGASELPVRFALGTAELTVGFRAGTDPQVDLQAAYGAVDRARGSLPPGISPYAEIMGSAINEVADYSVLIPAGVSPAVVQRAIRTRVLPALRALPGVQRIELFCALRAGHESGAPRLPARLPNPDPFDRHPPSVLHAARIHQCGQSPEAPQGAECAPAGLTSAHPGAGLLAAAVLPAAA
jgi:hypothetical protein